MATNDRCIVLPSTKPDSYLGEEDMSATAKDIVKDAKLLELLKLAMDQGWEVKPTNNGKLLWYPKDKDMPTVPSPTRLVGRTLANVRTALERSGLDTSSLKNDKPKKQRGAVLVSNDPEVLENPDKELTDTEQVHVEFQNLLAQTLSELIHSKETVVEDKADTINTSIDVYLLSVGKALMQFMDDTREALGCSHTADEQLQAKLDEAERLYLETCNELETLRKHADKLQAANSNLGTKVRELTEEKTAAQERALKAENRLKALRTALTED